MLKATKIIKNYGDLQVLKGVDIDIHKGEIVSIIGASGAGKSTLLHILGTLDKADVGEIMLNGERVDKLSGKNLAAFRNKNIGFIFQFHHLLPDQTALANVAMPALIARLSLKEAEARATELLVRVGLERRLTHRPGELSGGEQQRVAIARALMMHPKLILADEPTGNLDPATAGEVLGVLREIQRERGVTMIVVTHALELANRFDRVLRLVHGRFVPA